MDIFQKKVRHIKENTENSVALENENKVLKEKSKCKIKERLLKIFMKQGDVLRNKQYKER